MWNFDDYFRNIVVAARAGRAVIFDKFSQIGDNKVKVLGNPLDKSSVKALYLKEITGKEQTESTIIRFLTLWLVNGLTR